MYTLVATYLIGISLTVFEKDITVVDSLEYCIQYGKTVEYYQAIEGKSFVWECVKKD